MIYQHENFAKYETHHIQRRQNSRALIPLRTTAEIAVRQYALWRFHAARACTHQLLVVVF